MGTAGGLCACREHQCWAARSYDAVRPVKLEWGRPADSDVTAIYIEAIIESTMPGTQFVPIGFCGGYFGLQDSPEIDGHQSIIFSVEKLPGSTLARKRAAFVTCDEASRKSNFQVLHFGRYVNVSQSAEAIHFRDDSSRWQVGKKLRFLVVHAGMLLSQTCYAAYVDLGQDWQHHASVSVACGRSFGDHCSCIEDLRRDGASLNEERRSQFGPVWFRLSDGRWQLTKKATFMAGKSKGPNQTSVYTQTVPKTGRRILATGGAVKDKENSEDCKIGTERTVSAPADKTPPDVPDFPPWFFNMPTHPNTPTSTCSPRPPAVTSQWPQPEEVEETNDENEDGRVRGWSFREAIDAENVEQMIRRLSVGSAFMEVVPEEAASGQTVENQSSTEVPVESLQIGNNAEESRVPIATQPISEPLADNVEKAVQSPSQSMTTEKTGKRQAIKDSMKTVKNRGRELFERMALNRKQEESNEVEVETPKTERLSISTQRLQSGKWRVYGIHEDVMVQIGLEALDKSFSEEGLMDFPRRANGSSMLLREPLIKSMLNGTRNLKSTHKGDVSAAQGDIKFLSFRQLLKFRTLHLDYDPHRHESTKVQAAFLQTLDQNLFEQLAKKTVGATADLFAPASLRKFGLDLTLLVAASDALSSGRGCPPLQWACYLQGQLVYFDFSAFQCGADFPEGGVLEIGDLSKLEGQRRAIDWNVTLMDSEEDVGKSVTSFDVDSSSFSYGAQGSSFNLSRETLATQLRSLKKVDR